MATQKTKTWPVLQLVRCAIGCVTLISFCAPTWAQSGFADTLLVGRSGWVLDRDGGGQRIMLRSDLVAPSDLYRPAGFLMLACDRSGFHLYFNLSRSGRLSLPENIADGFVHFTFPRHGDADDKAPRTSLYVRFTNALSFQSAGSGNSGGDPVTTLVDLLRVAGLTATMVISPRRQRDGFEADKRFRLIFEPTPTTPDLDKQAGLNAFVDACSDRAG